MLEPINSPARAIVCNTSTTDCIRRILNLISAKNGEVTAAAAARLAGRSASWTRHNFTPYAGVTFRTACLMAKLVRGEELLGNTQLSIRQVAARLGYKDRAKFDKAFKKIYGVTPFEYRRTPPSLERNNLAKQVLLKS